MLESFILIIYYNSHEYLKMLNHSYAELRYAEECNAVDRIINCKSHIGLAYKYLGLLDSAYIYCSSYKDHEKDIDSVALSIAYHNVAIIIDMMGIEERKNIENFLLKSLSFNNNRKDVAKTYMKIADYYYNINKKEKADSFLNIFHKSIRKNDYDSYYNISKTLNNYYEKTGNIDSANKYKGEMLKYRIMRDSAIRASRVTEITHQSEIDKIEQQSQEKTATVAVASTVVVVGLAAMLFLYRRKKVKLGLDYADNVRKLEGTLA